MRPQCVHSEQALFTPTNKQQTRNLIVTPNHQKQDSTRRHAFGRSLRARPQSARNGRTAKPLRRLRRKDSEHRRKQQTSTPQTCAGAGAQAEATKFFWR